MIEILYTPGCPHRAPARDLVRSVVAEFGCDDEIREIEVRTPDDAERLRFPGSPTVRVDGVDVEPAARSASGHALGCRLYAGAGVPPRELLVRALSARGALKR